MNIVVAKYYGHVDPSQVEGQVDMSIPLALRRVWEAGANTTKVSFIHEDRLRGLQKDLDVLGGREKASAAIDAAREWLTAWDEGEAQGIAGAHATMKSYFEDAWVKQSKALDDENSETSEVDLLISDAVRSF